MRNSKPPQSPAGETAARAPAPVDFARVRTWPPAVRFAVRGLLLRGVDDLTPAALQNAVREITDLIDQANREEGHA